MDFDTYNQVSSLHSEYSLVVDSEDWDRWLDMFVEDCQYKLQARENFDAGLPLATLAFSSKGMLKDRIYAISETLYHEPYYQRHVVSTPLITSVDNDVIRAEANYAVFRTKPDQLSEVFNVGRYIDEIKRTSSGLKFKSRLCVFDSEMIPNSIIYPI